MTDNGAAQEAFDGFVQMWVTGTTAGRRAPLLRRPDEVGLAYEDVVALKPDVIYVHAAGYGSDGPYAGEPAYDDLIQSASGLADAEKVQVLKHPIDAARMAATMKRYHILFKKIVCERILYASINRAPDIKK